MAISADLSFKVYHNFYLKIYARAEAREIAEQNKGAPAGHSGLGLGLSGSSSSTTHTYLLRKVL